MTADRDDPFEVVRAHPDVLDRLTEKAEACGYVAFAEACRQAKELILSEKESA